MTELRPATRYGRDEPPQQYSVTYRRSYRHRCVDCGTSVQLPNGRCMPCHRNHRIVEFWRQVDLSATGDGCWPWLGSLGKGGYGRVSYRGWQTYSHRVSWLLANGAIPAGMYVLHRCDNPPCVRPSHLFLGTLADNNRDRSSKGRSARLAGSRNPRSRLTERAVRLIRQDFAAGVPQKVLAAQWGVSPAHISQIVTFRRWAVT